MADELVRDCEKNGLLNWGHSRKPKYSERQYQAALQNMYFDDALPSEVRYRGSPELDARRHSGRSVIKYCNRFMDYPGLTKERMKLAWSEGRKYAEKKVAPEKKDVAKRR